MVIELSLYSTFIYSAFVQYETTASALAAFQVLSENFEVTLESDLVNINNNLVVAATLLKNAARDSGHQVKVNLDTQDCP